MQARDVMTTHVVTVQPDTTVQNIAGLLLERRISAVPVVDRDGRVVGIVSEGDLMRRPESGNERHTSWWLELWSPRDQRVREYLKSHGLHAQDIMTQNVITVAEDASLQQIATLLEGHRIKRVPVLRDGKLVGIVSRANLLQALATVGIAASASGDEAGMREAILAELIKAGIRIGLLNVVVTQGVALLWGAVDSQTERQAALLAAERTLGVTRVEDHLAVLTPFVRAVN